MGKKTEGIEKLKLSGKDEGFAAYCDHTVLRAYATTAIIRELCDEAVKYGTAAVCVNPIHVSFVKNYLKGTGIKTATVIGFPLGAAKPSVKVFEAREAVADGADELDMVINVGALRDGNHALVYEDIKGVVDTAGDKAIVKVIIETCYLSKEQKIEACKISARAGAKFVKTSTGMGTGGATVKDVLLMKESAGGGVRVKASGNIEDRATAYAMLAAGAARLGVSRVPQIVEDDTSIISLSKRNQPPKYDEGNAGGSAAADLRGKRLLHERDLRSHNVQRDTVVLVSKKTIITTLAHDYAKSLGVKIVRQK